MQSQDSDRPNTIQYPNRNAESLPRLREYETLGWDLIICQCGWKGDDAQRCESHSNSSSCDLFAWAHTANGSARKCRTTLGGYICDENQVFLQKGESMMLPGIFNFIFYYPGSHYSHSEIQVNFESLSSCFSLFCSNISAVGNQTQLNYNHFKKMSCIMKIMEPET